MGESKIKWRRFEDLMKVCSRREGNGRDGNCNFKDLSCVHIHVIITTKNQQETLKRFIGWG